MEASILLQIIKDDIKILNNLAVDLDTNTGLTSDEVEIVLARARNVVKELELLESKVSEKAGLSSLNIPHEKTPIVEKRPNEVVEEAAPVINREKEPKVEKPTESKEPEVEEKKEPVIEEHEEESDMELLEVEQEKNKTLGESIAAQRSLNDLIGEDYKEDSFTNRPLKSIREGISLNDRYLFVRELFENSNDKFNEAVDSLDHADSIQDAVHFLKSNYKWSKTETSQKFLTLVKRRFLN